MKIMYNKNEVCIFNYDAAMGALQSNDRPPTFGEAIANISHKETSAHLLHKKVQLAVGFSVVVLVCNLIYKFIDSYYINCERDRELKLKEIQSLERIKLAEYGGHKQHDELR